MANPLFGPILRQYLQDSDDAGMRDFCENLHPATIAETLHGDFTIPDAWRVLEHAPIREQAAVFEYFDRDTQVAMVEGTGRERMAKLIEQMSHDDREEAARQLARFDLIAMPVVDDDGRLVGIVTHDDAIDVVEQEATEDLQRQGGVGPMTENYLEASFLKIWRKRAFWLSCL